MPVICGNCGVSWHLELLECSGRIHSSNHFTSTTAKTMLRLTVFKLTVLALGMSA